MATLVGVIAEHPFTDYLLYRVFHKGEGRWYACLVDRADKSKRTTMAFARYRLCVLNGRELNEDEEADHKDDNKLNDSDDNLQILTKAENLKKTSTGRTTVCLICPACGNPFVRERRQTHLVKGGSPSKCSKECSHRVQMNLAKESYL